MIGHTTFRELAALVAEARIAAHLVRMKLPLPTKKEADAAQAVEDWLRAFLTNELPGHLRGAIATGVLTIHLSSGRGEVPDDRDALHAASKFLSESFGLRARVERMMDGPPDATCFSPMWQLYIDL